MMKDARETADLAGFLICLCLGFTFAFEVLIPALHDVQMEMMKYLFGVGFGFGVGVCFYLIWVPIQHVIVHVYDKVGAFLESRTKGADKGNPKARIKKGDDEVDSGDLNE